jgi:hypothetical protein
MNRLRRLLMCVCLLPVVLSVPRLTADQVYSGIRGAVTDPQGAAVTDASIKVTNIGTGISWEVSSGSDGSYQFLQLPIGSYNLTATKSGFKTFSSTGIVLVVDRIYVQNIVMQVGAIAETVTVEANAAQVESTSMELNSIVGSRTLVDMPLNGRTYLQLQQLVPGVVSASDRFGAFFAYSANGNETQQNSYLVNGTDSNDVLLNIPMPQPNPDAVAEFALVTNTINPEYGRNSGAIVNAVIKSGTNALHGSAWEFYRDTRLNAKGFLEDARSIFHRNQFGGTLGGPIWKDHTFFFVSWEDNRDRIAEPGTSTIVNVPSGPERGGNFGAGFFANATNGSAIPLFGDPCPVSGGTPCAAGTPYSTLFASGIIPSADFNSISANLLAKGYIPQANLGANFFFNPVQTDNDNQVLFRIDHTFNKKDSIWWYSFFDHDPQVQDISFFGGNLPGFAQSNLQFDQQHTAAWNHVFTATALNEFRVGYTRINLKFGDPLHPMQPSALGFTGIIPQNSSEASAPLIGVSSPNANFSTGFSINGPQPRVDPVYQVKDNFSVVAGRHSLRFGFSGSRYEVNQIFSRRNNGQFFFDGFAPFTTGDGYADFLLGISDGYSQASGKTFHSRAYEAYSYAQDQYKIRPNLTLTYGLAWDVETPMTDHNNHGRAINCFSPSDFASGTPSVIFPLAPAGLLFPGDKGCSSSGYSTRLKDFAPRVGFAWSPNLGWLSGGPGKLSIRGGWGLYYNRTEEEVTLQNTGSPPFAKFSNGIGNGLSSFAAPFTDKRCIDQNGNPIVGGACPAVGGTVPNGFPFVIPTGGNVDFSQFFLSINVIDPNFRSPFSENYNLTIERQLPGNIVLSLGYVGAEGHHLETSVELNTNTNPQQCAAIPSCAADAQNLVFDPNAKFKYGPTFPSLGQEQTIGNSVYNSLQISARKTAKNGLTFQAAYTYAHSIDTSSNFENHSFNPEGYNPIEPSRNRGNSDFDARQRFTISYIYDLPSPHRFRTLAGGWRFGGITTFQTGFPVQISDNPGFGDLSSLTCPGGFNIFYSCWQYPDVSGPVHLLNPRNPGHLLFDPSVFSEPALATFGNVRRNFLHGYGINNFDIQASKTTKLSERVSLELRFEAFNVFNHSQFVNPDGNFAAGQNGLFGVVQSAQPPRIMQLAAKVYF